MTRVAACSCGQLSVTATGEPAFVAACSCIECQRSTGSVFGVFFYYPKSATAISGEGRLYRRSSAKNTAVDNYFCPNCGSTLYGYLQSEPDLIGISAGNFGDPGLEPPQFAVWCESKHPWVVFPEACEQHPQQP
jgi:hypothetical protein